MQKLSTPYMGNPGTSSNWTGRTPRTMQEAFPQYPGLDYVEPSLKSKILDCIVLFGGIGALAFFAYFGVTFFGRLS